MSSVEIFVRQTFTPSVIANTLTLITSLILRMTDSGDLRGVAGGDGELGCLCGEAGTSHLCDGSAHSSGWWSMALMLWLPFELLLLY